MKRGVSFVKMSKNDYDFYKKIGICPDCRKNPAVSNRVFCDDCAEKKKRTIQKKRKKEKDSQQNCAGTEEKRDMYTMRQLVCGTRKNKM